jgi:hypothetical protein
MHASLSRFVASLAVAAALLGLGAMPAAQAEVVFGNLGASATAALSTTNTDITSTYRIAVPFTTGSDSSFLKLQSITLGLFYDNFLTSSFGLSIYEDNSGVPSATVAATAPAQNIGIVGLYTFNFSSFQMASNKTYWIQPAVDLSWYTPNSGLTPVAYSSSGYTWPGTGTASIDSGSTWDTDELFVNNGRYAFSVQAVPEPSTFVLMATALGLGCVAATRRRRA